MSCDFFILGMRGTSCSTGSGLWTTLRSTHSILPWDPLSWQTGRRQSRYRAINATTLLVVSTGLSIVTSIWDLSQALAS